MQLGRARTGQSQNNNRFADTFVRQIQPGDELELVGGLEAFAADRARVMRDLTRGFALVVLPEQSRREWSWVGAGGVARPAESGSLAR